MPKSVLITGCSVGGSGHALAREFLAKGYRVFATARRVEAMGELEKEGAVTLALDVTDEDAIRKVREQVSAVTGGTLDILVNNAVCDSCLSKTSFPERCLAELVPAINQRISEARSIMDTNFFGPLYMTQEFVQLLIASGNVRIVNVASIGAVMPLPFCAVYNASKAALVSLSNTLRLELAPFGVKIITVMSGSVKTNIVKPHTLPKGSMYVPYEDIYQEKRVKPIMLDAMPPAEYAHKVVSEIIKPNPRNWLWIGTHSFFCWFVDTFFGQCAFVSVIVITLFAYHMC
ncbi:NAD(P)-binding protein [Daedalea quercina L-15889]|uniref:NAD(P)-binding protein n=1 Tax=Daedalea quercina L-15889 TaxID=1314783 RepID=A0A165PR98_9APHY|nr:NAD(P)-binding protein [Daedalea quercina L-15889]